MTSPSARKPKPIPLQGFSFYFVLFYSKTETLGEEGPGSGDSPAGTGLLLMGDGDRVGSGPGTLAGMRFGATQASSWGFPVRNESHAEPQVRM